MMKCKKGLVAGVVAVCMMGAMGVNAFASEADNSNNKKTTDVKYVVSESYEWSVPTEIEFTDTNKTITADQESGKLSKVTVSKNVIAETKKLKITAVGSGDEGAFSIKNGYNTTLGYTVKAGNSDVEANGEVLSVLSGTNTGSTTLTFTLTSLSGNNTAEVPGTYTGSITYTASVVDANE